MNSLASNVAAAFLEKRRDERFQVQSILPALFLDVGNHQSITCRVNDISKTGMRVILASEVKEGQPLILVTLENRFTFLVMWCRELPAGRGWSAGLLATSRVDLRSLFSSHLTLAAADTHQHLRVR